VRTAYFDASALVKLVVDEAGSESAAVLWDGCGAAVTNRLTYPEVRAALSAARRSHRITSAGLSQAETMWEEYWAGMVVVELSAAIAQEAGELAKRHRLGGADAVHLATAQALDEPSLVVVAWDRRLHAGARASGFAVAPAVLGP
jgi:predicted nucleic acid-binding protein